MTHLEQSRALWNRQRLDLRSEETLAQIMDRGEIQAWREIYALARHDEALRARLLSVARRVPMAYRHFWLAALASLGCTVDYAASVPDDRADV